MPLRFLWELHRRGAIIGAPTGVVLYKQAMNASTPYFAHLANPSGA